VEVVEVVEVVDVVAAAAAAAAAAVVAAAVVVEVRKADLVPGMTVMISALNLDPLVLAGIYLL